MHKSADFHVDGGGIRGSCILVIMDSVIGLSLCHSQRGAAYSEDTPEQVCDIHIGEDIADCTVGNESEDTGGAYGSESAYLGISDIGIITRSVDEADDEKCREA